MTVNILGSTWTILYRKPSEDKLLSENDGYCDHSSRKIVVISEGERTELDDFKAYQKRCLRHEIIHAFMFESGLGHDWEHKNYGQEETVVDWIALQFPKILKAFKEVKAL